MGIQGINKNKGFSFVGILIVVAIVGFLYYYASMNYFGKSTLDEETEEQLEEQGIDTSSQGALLESALERIDEMEDARGL